MSSSLTVLTLAEQKSSNAIAQTMKPDAPEQQLKLEAQSSALVEQIFQLDIADTLTLQQYSSAIRQLGLNTQQQLTKRSHLLKQPLANLVAESEIGSVSHSLLALQEQTSKINPNHINFNMGGLRRLISKIPAVGTPLARWFAKFQLVDNVIQDIVNDLKQGQARLERDNITLEQDQRDMNSLIVELKKYISYSLLLDEKISQRLADAGQLEEAQRRFIEEELLFLLKQRTLDLQQQLAVNQQGVLTSDVIIKNNRELIRGVSRALNVTVSALNIAASLAIALQSQKNVANSITALNSTTDDLISNTSKILKQQAAQIHQQAASAQLNTDNLKQSFENILTTINDISRFRHQAIPEMTKSINEMSELTSKMDDSLAALGDTDGANNKIMLDIR